MFVRKIIMERLQADLPRAVLPEQTPVPNVSPEHLHAPIPDLFHESKLRAPTPITISNCNTSAQVTKRSNITPPEDETVTA